jgi:hypothetical protein
LNDPIAGVSALQRIGITFSDTQKEMIANFMATGDIAGAQAVILAELENQIGGLAETMGGTFAGKWEIFKNRLGEVQEGIGKLLVHALTPLLDMVGGDSPIGAGLDIIADTLGTLNDYLDKGVPFFQALGLAINGLAQNNPAVATFADILKTIGYTFIEMQGVLDEGGTIFDAIAVGLERISGLVDGTPLEGLITTIQTFFETAEQDGWGAAFGELFNNLVAGIGTADISTPIQTLLGRLQQILADTNWDTVGRIIADVISGAILIVLEGLNILVNQVNWEPLGVALSGALRQILAGMFSSESAAELDETFGNWSRDVWQSMEEGLHDGFNTMDLGIKQWANDKILQPIKDFFGIASPSSVFKQIGKDIIQGLIDGISGMLSSITTIITGVVDTLLAPLAPVLDLLGIDLPTGSTSTGTTGGRSTGTAPGSPTGTGGVLSTAGGVVNNFYGAVYFGDMGQLGYDCPSPHPLMTASSQSLLTSGLE